MIAQESNVELLNSRSAKQDNKSTPTDAQSSVECRKNYELLEPSEESSRRFMFQEEQRRRRVAKQSNTGLIGVAAGEAASAPNSPRGQRSKSISGLAPVSMSKVDDHILPSPQVHRHPISPQPFSRRRSNLSLHGGSNALPCAPTELIVPSRTRWLFEKRFCKFYASHSCHQQTYAYTCVDPI